MLDSIGFRLGLFIVGTIVLGFGVFAYVYLTTTADYGRSSVTDDARKILEIIERSTHWAMLHNQKEDVSEIVRNVGEQPDVVGVRIFDKNGRIVFSDRESEIGHKVELHGEACVSCHISTTEVITPDTDKRVRIFTARNGQRVLGMTNAIDNKPECSNADCHAHPPDKTTLGVLDVRVSLARADARRHEVERQVVVAAVSLALLAALVVGSFVQVMVRRPVRRLIEGTELVARGDLDVQLHDANRNELGQLSRAFDSMTRDLREARDQLAEAREAIESRLDEKTDELSRTQRQVVHMEKMASLGKLSATVAHELNNPLAGILNYAKLVNRYLAELDSWADRDEVARCVKMIGEEASRCGDIVRNLLVFARRTGSSMTEAHLHEVSERALMLVRHQMQIASVALEEKLGASDDALVCDVGQLQQALVALLINAIQAMAQGGSLKLATRDAGDSICIEICDSGPGIPDDVLPHIFEPFYSTKLDGQGVGLGLAVVYGIVQRHGGEIRVDTTLGTGTCFEITLPRHPTRAQMESSAPPVVGALERETEVKP
ncbi:MAG: ATP-binding protein [Pseudomonadota bacterium]